MWIGTGVRRRPLSEKPYITNGYDLLVPYAAYGTLLREPRRALHARIARTLDENFVEVRDNQPEILAYHCAQAGESALAIEWWSKAGERDMLRSAYAEAIMDFERAIGLLPEAPVRQPSRLSRYTAQRGHGIFANWKDQIAWRLPSGSRRFTPPACQASAAPTAWHRSWRGMYQTHSTQSISDHLASRIEPVRTTVMVRNSSARASSPSVARSSRTSIGQAAPRPMHLPCLWFSRGAGLLEPQRRN